MKALYFCDLDDGMKQDLEIIQRKLHDNSIDGLKIKLTTLPPFKENYDILFFDWGGMSMGNSMLEHFCEHFIEDAREHPSRLFVMTSLFTKNAMEDILQVLDRETDKPANVFLDIDDAAPAIKILLGTEKKSSNPQSTIGNRKSK